MDTTDVTGHLLYFAMAGEGGVAEYALYQSTALARAGVKVVCLGDEKLKSRILARFPEIEFIPLPHQPVRNPKRNVFLRLISSLRHQVACVRKLSRVVREHRIQKVLISCYAEYWAPFWVWSLRRLHRRNVRFGVVAHDPIRDFRAGPIWWHNWSVSLAYSYIDVAFLHSPTRLDTGWPKRTIKTIQVPDCPYEIYIPDPLPTQAHVREKLGIPREATVLLSFGHVRDGKNLNLTIEALAQFPNCHLIVAGRAQSASNRGERFYQELAERVGVTNRCHWFTDFIPDQEIWKYFTACDVVLLTYSASFHSASGVLNLAIPFHKPVIASAGDGSLKESVTNYHLGVWCEPDSVESIRDGIQRFLQTSAREFDWARYSEDHSWARNAEIVLSNL